MARKDWGWKEKEEEEEEEEEKLHIRMDIASFQTRSSPSADVDDLGKKRKLLSVELDLPEAKYICVESEGDCDAMSLQSAEGETLTDDGQPILDTSLVESAKDSNSIADDSDTAMSAFVCVDVNHGLDHAMGKDIASTSAKWPDCDHTKESGSDVELGCDGQSSHDHDRQILDEQHAEFVVDLTYGCSDSATATASHEVEDRNYILSSGRISSVVNKEAVNISRRPTIDKEFEEYFSTLMM